MITKDQISAVIGWNAVHGLDVSIDDQRQLCQDEWQEWYKSNCTDLLEVGDVGFTAIQLRHIVKQSGEPHHTSYNEFATLAKERNAYRHLDAVIASNWTKYMPITKYKLIDASLEAEKASKKYAGRYTQIVPRLSACGKYYFLLGMTKGGIKKVIKPSCFVEAEKFL